jgi:hypothetical protein
MPILSALDAISPAFSRTRLVLFTPFRKGRTWKLAATAYLSILSTIFIPYFLIALFFIPMAHRAGGSTAVTLLIAISSVVTAVYLVIFYLCSRLRFALFDIALNRGEFVAPAWRKYGPQSLKWAGLKAILGAVVMAVVAIPSAALIRHIIPVFATLPQQPGKQLPPEFVSALISFYGAFLLIYAVIGLFYFVSSLLSDFIVPSLALEDTTLAVAFRRLGQLIRREPGQFTLYAVLKIGLALAAYMAVTIGFYIVALVMIIVVGLIAALIGSLLHLAHVPTTVLFALAIPVGIACYLLVFFYVMVIGMGTAITFLESYTLYFLSGRYPMLGDLLQQSTPPPSLPPHPVYPAYYTPPTS